MAVAIIVEDGSIVENANSYNTLVQLKAYLEGHPYGAATLALGDDALNKGLIHSFNALNSAATWQGTKVEWDQEGEFPRDGIDPVPNDAIPKGIRIAQCELVRWTLASDRDKEADGAAVKREKLDVLEVEYQQGAKRDLIPEIVQRMIAPFVASIADDAGIGGAPTSGAYFLGRG